MTMVPIHSRRSFVQRRTIAVQETGRFGHRSPYIQLARGSRGAEPRSGSIMRLYSPDHQQFRDAQSLMEPKTHSAWAKPLTLAAMSLGYGVVQLDVTIVNTALNSMGSALGGGVSELQWVVSTYTIAFASLILTAGALGDRLGAKKIFMVGFSVFTAASLACALAPTSGILIAARAAQGVGAAILVPNSLALLSHAYPQDKERGRA